MSNLLGTLGNQLLRIAYLKFLRRLASKLPSSSSSPSTATSNDAFVLSSASLGHEYLVLGKSARAGFVFAQAEARIKAGGVGSEAQVEYWLRYAEYLAMLGSHERAHVLLSLFPIMRELIFSPPRSVQAYDTALQLADELEKEAEAAAPVSASVKIVERTVLLQRTALAAHVCSVLLQRKVRSFFLSSFLTPVDPSRPRRANSAVPSLPPCKRCDSALER
jgi:separase